MKATGGVMRWADRSGLSAKSVHLCVGCMGSWFGCSCKGHLLFYPLWAIDRGWFQESREVGPA